MYHIVRSTNPLKSSCAELLGQVGWQLKGRGLRHHRVLRQAGEGVHGDGLVLVVHEAAGVVVEVALVAWSFGPVGDEEVQFF